MKGSRPAQGALTEKNDLSKTDETRRVVERMVDGLNNHEIDGMGNFSIRIFAGSGMPDAD